MVMLEADPPRAEKIKNQVLSKDQNLSTFFDFGFCWSTACAGIARDKNLKHFAFFTSIFLFTKEKLDVLLVIKSGT